MKKLPYLVPYQKMAVKMLRLQDKALQPLDEIFGFGSAFSCRKGWSGTENKMHCPVVPSLVARDLRIRKDVLRVGIPIDLLGHTLYFMMTNPSQDLASALPSPPKLGNHVFASSLLHTCTRVLCVESLTCAWMIRPPLLRTRALLLY